MSIKTELRSMTLAACTALAFAWGGVHAQEIPVVTGDHWTKSSHRRGQAADRPRDTYLRRPSDREGGRPHAAYLSRLAPGRSQGALFAVSHARCRAQGRGRGQRRHALLGLAARGQRRRGPAVPPVQGGAALRARALCEGAAVGVRGQTYRRGAAADPGRTRYLPGLGRGDRRDPLLHASAPRHEGQLGIRPRDHADEEHSRLLQALRLGAGACAREVRRCRHDRRLPRQERVDGRRHLPHSPPRTLDRPTATTPCWPRQPRTRGFRSRRRRRRGASVLLAADDLAIGELADDEICESGRLSRNRPGIERGRRACPYQLPRLYVVQLGFHAGEVVLGDLLHRDPRPGRATPRPAAPARAARHHRRRHLRARIHAEQAYEQQALGTAVVDGGDETAPRVAGSSRRSVYPAMASTPAARSFAANVSSNTRPSAAVPMSPTTRIF